MITFAPHPGGGFAVKNAPDSFLRDFPDPHTWPWFQGTEGPVRALRIPEPFHVETADGQLHECDSGYLLLDTAGQPWPVEAEIFDRSYTPTVDMSFLDGIDLSG